MSRLHIKCYLIFILLIIILISLSFVSAAYSATLDKGRYINRTYVAEINISILAGANGSIANITDVTIVLPEGFSFITGTNLSTLSMTFLNTSSNLIWNTTDNTLFGAATRHDFRFNVTSNTAGDATITVTATKTDTNNNQSTFSVTTNFKFEGYVRNETGGNESNVNITIYRFTFTDNAPPTQVFEKNVLTDANGSFSIASINGSASNYVLKMIRYGNSGSGCVSSNASCNATMIGTVLPPFPSNLYYPAAGGGFDFSLNGSSFYLQPAATLRLYTWAYNSANTITQQRFGYEVIDQRVGFPVDSNILQNVTTKDIVVPAGKDYSVMFVREFSQFPSQSGCNGTTYNDSACPSPPLTNSSLGTINAGDLIIVNQSLLISRNDLYGCVNVQLGHNSTPINVTSVKLKMIPFTTSSGSFVPPIDAARGDINISDTAQLNATNSSGTATSLGITCPGSIAAYNFSVMGSTSGISYLLEMYAKNTTVASEDSVDVGGNYLAGFMNITITTNTQKNLTLYKLLGNYVNGSINKDKLNTSMMQINIQNDTGGAITSSMHVEVSVKNSAIGIGTVHYMIETLTNGTFYIPILNNSDRVEVSIYPNDGPPLAKKLNLSLNENNITLITIDFGGEGDKGIRQFNASGDLEVINASAMPIDIRFLRRGSDSVITEFSSSSFNPLKALVAGNIDLELRVKSNNVTMRFNNFDMFSAKQPPMFAIIDNNTLTSSTSQSWKFGNFVPKDVYDNVTITIPYDDSVVTESNSFNMSIQILYTEDLSRTHELIAAWNISRGDTTANLTDEFIAYNVTRYRDYLTTAGIECSKTDISSVCYINTTANTLRFEIPHFSGVLPSITGVAAATSSSSSSTEGGSVGTTTTVLTYTVTPNLLAKGFTKSLPLNGQFKMNISGEWHILKVKKIGLTTIDIEVSSIHPQLATLSIGETKKFDLTANNFYDLSVILNNIANNKSNITVMSIHETIESTEEIIQEEPISAAEEIEISFIELY